MLAESRFVDVGLSTSDSILGLLSCLLLSLLFWLLWVFIEACQLSLVAAHGDFSTCGTKACLVLKHGHFASRVCGLSG